MAEAERRRKLLDKAAEKWGMAGIKACPGCAMPCERVSGCGHMLCPSEKCGVHWCFFCGIKVKAEEVYEHMHSVHGGFFGGEDEFDDEDWGITVLACS